MGKTLMRNRLTIIWLFIALPISASDIYVAQVSAGGNTGADCADARAYTSLTATDWSVSTIGNTVHLCGTFSLAAGSSGTIPITASGSAGNVITLKFETGANATAPYWGTNGFITAASQSYIVVDGGTNGLIQATANGAALANVQPSAGIYFNSVSNSEIKNLTIANIFVGSAGNNNNGTDGYGINWLYGSNIHVDHNIIHDCRWCLSIAYQGSTTSSNWEVDHNIIYNIDHGPTFSSGNTNAILNGTNLIHDNIIHDFYMFDDPADNAHHDGIHVFAVQSGTQIADVKVYNNTFYGNPGADATAFLFSDAESGGTIQIEAFNNVVTESTSNAPALFWMESNTPAIYDNTLIGASTASGGCLFFYGTNSVAKNNVFTGCNSGIYVQGGSISASDYNDFYNLPGDVVIISGGSSYSTLAAWQASSGSPDAHSISTNPSLNGLGRQQSGSPVIGAAINLTSLSITALDSDILGNARPGGSIAWDIGAYFGAAATSPQKASPGILGKIIGGHIHATLQ